MSFKNGVHIDTCGFSLHEVDGKNVFPGEVLINTRHQELRRIFQQLHDSCITAPTSLMGMGLASARTLARIADSSAGSKSPESMDRSCPTFITAPRSSDCNGML